MRITIAIFATFLATVGAFAQQPQTGPFTRQEAELMSAVWPEIRQAAAFEEINWQAVGLTRPPGDREARRVMANHWDALRSAVSFDDIDWQTTTGYAASRPSRFAHQEQVGPFTSQEAELMSAVWPEIRQAATFEEIDWRSVGLPGAPGDRDARRVMATHWDSLRSAAEFDNIDWQATTGYRGR